MKYTEVWVLNGVNVPTIYKLCTHYVHIVYTLCTHSTYTLSGTMIHKGGAPIKYRKDGSVEIESKPREVSTPNRVIHSRWYEIGRNSARDKL